ncbi:hypothetical protein Y023_3581 [Burkholderia pseudomallei A79D]|nr:hypothetical protein X997_4691 [Burkholderia pseudomallei A79C]KGX99998.1 hypothetical protein Y023_3581 [Burkholderia pseudomallei A79D]
MHLLRRLSDCRGALALHHRETPFDLDFFRAHRQTLCWRLGSCLQLLRLIKLLAHRIALSVHSAQRNCETLLVILLQRNLPLLVCAIEFFCLDLKVLFQQVKPGLRLRVLE